MPQKTQKSESKTLGITEKQAKSARLDFERLKTDEKNLEPGTRKVLEQENLDQKGKENIRSWIEFVLALNRLYIATKTSNPASLGKAIGIKSASVYPALKKHEIPDSWFVAVGKKFNVSIDWLTGNTENLSQNLKNEPTKSKEGTFDEMLKIIGEEDSQLHDKLIGEIVRNFNKLNKGRK
jgi:hypothetical protein